MSDFLNNSNSTQNARLEYFRIRLKARLFIILIFFVQIAQRVYDLYGDSALDKMPMEIYIFTFPCLFVLICIIIIECALYYKLGARVLKYTSIIDGIFFITFTVEWITAWYSVLSGFLGSNPVTASYFIGFSSFAWRTLLQNFIVQRWYVRSIGPVCAYGLLIGFAVTLDPDETKHSIMKGVSYAIYLIGIFYLEDKMNWSLLLANIKQDKWIKINNFILNNIPEKIAILDHCGDVLYANDYLNDFTKECGFSNDIKKMFKEIRALQRQCEPSDSINLCTTEKALIEKPNFFSANDYDTETCSLEILIKNFLVTRDISRLKDQGLQIFRGKLSLQDASEKSIEVKISQITQDSKHYIILILQDTTQRDLLVTLESNNKYKDHLLATVSHELRTPLNGTINLVDAAINTNDVPEEVKDNLLVPALKSSKFLLHLINDILDMSQITAQKLRLAFNFRDLKETLIECVQLVELSAKKKAIDLKVVVDTKLPRLFYTDHARLSQIIMNLLNNSIKFTQEGSIKVVASMTEDSSNVKISVEDSGIGMTREDIEKLFQKYTHIDHEGRENINPTGVGLGLNIAYNLAVLLGPAGNKGITVESTPEKGSVFSFVLIQQDIEQALMTQKTLRNDGVSEDYSEISGQMIIDIEPTIDKKMFSRFSTKSIKRATGFNSVLSTGLCECPVVLAVDDDHFNMLAYESIMRSLNVRLDTVYNGKAALEKLLNRGKTICSPDCRSYKIVFMDQEMTGMSGCETVQRIRALEAEKKVASINIIGCTGHGGSREVDQFMKSGIDCCIQKPIAKATIKDLLEKYGVND